MRDGMYHFNGTEIEVRNSYTDESQRDDA